MPAIQMFYRDKSGALTLGDNLLGPADFLGIVPAIGDTIIDPGAPLGDKSSEPEHREFCTVVDRVFLPGDSAYTVGIVLQRRDGTAADEALLR